MNDLHRASSNLADALMFYARYVASLSSADPRGALGRDAMREMLEKALEDYGHALRRVEG